jgi:hypothetical protein
VHDEIELLGVQDATDFTVTITAPTTKPGVPANGEAGNAKPARASMQMSSSTRRDRRTSRRPWPQIGAEAADHVGNKVDESPNSTKKYHGSISQGRRRSRPRPNAVHRRTR